MTQEEEEEKDPEAKAFANLRPTNRKKKMLENIRIENQKKVVCF